MSTLINVRWIFKHKSIISSPRLLRYNQWECNRFAVMALHSQQWFVSIRSSNLFYMSVSDVNWSPSCTLGYIALIPRIGSNNSRPLAVSGCRIFCINSWFDHSGVSPKCLGSERTPTWTWSQFRAGEEPFKGELACDWGVAMDWGVPGLDPTAATSTLIEPSSSPASFSVAFVLLQKPCCSH